MIKKTVLTLAVLLVAAAPAATAAMNQAGRLAGYILLPAENSGQAWYVYPPTGRRYYLGRPADAFNIIKKLALGAKHDFIASTDIFPARLAGLILLDAEQNGQAYYIHPRDRKKYYLGGPADAFRVMRQLGQGSSNLALANISIGDIAHDNLAIAATEKILQPVPFTPQAPFGQWSDRRQADGCEEASALMAVKWARGQSLSKPAALAEIIGSSDFTLKKYGEFRDISLSDTLNWIIKDYFGYQKAALKKEVTVTGIISELKKGNIIIAPMNGRLLSNPYYTPPGPIRHMLVVRGYDPLKNVFIANDPGTRRGELYQYDVKVLLAALGDYPTGHNELMDKREKNIIVVEK